MWTLFLFTNAATLRKSDWFSFIFGALLMFALMKGWSVELLYLFGKNQLLYSFKEISCIRWKLVKN